MVLGFRGMRSECAVTDVFHSEIVAFIREHWLSNLAHNLSSPLSAARGYIRMILRNGCSDFSEADKRYLTRALDNLDKLVLQVRGLESWPDIQDLEFTSFRLGDLLQEVLETFRPSLAGNNTKVRERFRDGSAIMIGDRAKLRMALESFFDAAARFAIPNGVLGISACEKNGLIAIRLNADSAHPCAVLQPDLTTAARLWHVHGGHFCTSHTDNSYSLTCELPVIDFLQPQVLLSRED